MLKPNVSGKSKCSNGQMAPQNLDVARTEQVVFLSHHLYQSTTIKPNQHTQNDKTQKNDQIKSGLVVLKCLVPLRRLLRYRLCCSCISDSLQLWVMGRTAIDGDERSLDRRRRDELDRRRIDGAIKPRCSSDRASRLP